MESPNPPIKFYKVRDFSEKLNATFDFLRENWQSLLQFSFYLILPICLLQSFAINAMMRFSLAMGYESTYDSPTESLNALMQNVGIYMILILLGTSVVYAMTFSLMAAYERRDNRLLHIQWQDFKPSMIRNTLKALRLFLFTICCASLAVTLIIWLAVISTWTLILTIMAFLTGFIALMVPFSLMMPVYLFEDIRFVEALKKSFKYGFSAWGGTFVIVFVFGFLANIVSGVTMMPWYIVLLMGDAFSLSGQDTGMNASLTYQFITYLLGILQAYGMYLSLILSSVGIAFQYFHLREKNEGKSVDENIQNFDSL